MARKIQYIYHLFAFAELTCLDEFQVRADCYFRNIDSLVKHLSSMLCKIKGKRELIKNMDDQLVMTEPLFKGKITYVVRKIRKNDIMFNLLYLFDKEAALRNWKMDTLTDEFFKRIGESGDEKKRKPVKLPKIYSHD